MTGHSNEQIELFGVIATDNDCSPTELTYSTENSISPFRIESNSGKICIGSRLDYNAQNVYEFNVIATDSGGLATSTLVKIHVSDVNNNYPIFEQTNIEVSIPPTFGVSNPILAVRANDKDTGYYGLVTYSIKSGNINGLFVIDKYTGVVKLTRDISHLSLDSFALEIACQDGGGRKAQANAFVSILILRPSSSAPKVSFSKTLYSFEIDENSSKGAYIGRVAAALSSGTTPIYYTLLSGNQLNFTQLDPNTGTLRVNESPNHEKAKVVFLRIQARSGNVLATAQANITIKDLNDNTPKFNSNQVNLNLNERIHIGTEVYSVKATDEDSQQNGRIRYNLIDPTNTFILDESILKLQKKLNFEETKKYELKIIASDQGFPQKSTSLKLNIAVLDTNDHSPVFPRSLYKIETSENVDIATSLAKISAVDKDSRLNGKVIYDLEGPSNVKRHFGIFPNNGVLFNKVKLDREKASDFMFKIVARDRGTPSQTSTTSVILTILDSNDNAPQSLEDEYNFKISESKGPLAIVGSLYAHDIDEGINSKLSYSIEENALFSINSETGTIQLRKKLDRETQAYHELMATISDSGEPPLSAKIKVTIRVEDANDNKPEFTYIDQLVLDVNENEAKGYFLANVTAHDPDDGVNGAIRYFLEPDSDNEADYRSFRIHTHSGALRTHKVLDYEAKQFYSFRVEARDSGNPVLSNYQRVRVNVRDINEHQPRFDSNIIRFTVKENVPLPYIVGKLNASDLDFGASGTISYWIVGGNPFGTFGVNRTSGEIYAARTIDYELACQHEMIVEALDNSPNSPKFSKVKVIIKIEDINDNAPIMQALPPSISISENSPRGSLLHTFLATDKDDGPRGKVRYHIDNSDSCCSTWFMINENTGELRVNGNVDHEETNETFIVLKAQDQDPDSAQRLSVSSVIRIKILDENDNKPLFDVQSKIYMMEDEKVGYPVINIFATDKDSGLNGRLTYAIVSGNERGDFTLNPLTGLLSTSELLDRETIASYVLNISAQDGGTPRQISYHALRINLVDVNDDVPKFEYDIYEATIKENQKPGQIVRTVKAIDNDEGDFGTVEYLIPNGIAQNLFKINPNNGLITTTQKIDRESLDPGFVVFSVYARDKAYPAHYSSCQIHVLIEDENDNFPQFKHDHQTIYVDENERRTAVIYQFFASDKDLDQNSILKFDIIGGNTGKKFSIDQHNGELRAEPLDREEKASYTLTVLARDNGSPSKSSSATLTVLVNDENDNSPIFSSNYDISIPEDVDVGKEIVLISASDLDEGANAKISYYLDQDARGLFRIEKKTGKLRTRKRLDREKQEQIQISVCAKDGSPYNPKTTCTSVRIRLTDINDNAPEFEKSAYFSDDDDGIRDKFILQIKATDKDEGNNAKISFSIKENSQYFSINSKSGEIRTKANVPTGSYALTVLAKDGGSSQLSSSVPVRIRIGNKSGNNLQFTEAVYQVTLDENAPEDTIVTNVRTTSGNGVVYTFISGNELDTFKIDARGRITVKNNKRLDFEEIQTLKLVVLGESAGTYAYCTVDITIRDVNDNSPIFSENLYEAFISEENPPDLIVAQVSALDIDSDQYSKLTYHIISGNTNEVFKIEPAYTGVIKTNVILDREIKDRYELIIEAKDKGFPVNSASCTFIVTVLDVNDNAPFWPRYSPKKISENSQIGSIVMQVTANDADVDPKITYRLLTNPHQTFTIDRYNNTGHIFLAKKLDYELEKRFVLTIEATDADKKHTSTTTVEILVEDENDNAPKLDQSQYYVKVNELTKANQIVIRLNATDLDDGDNGRLTYEIEGGNQNFSIDATTGVISTKTDIVYTNNPIELYVQVRDNGKDPKSVKGQVIIDITDVNNNSPVFLNKNHQSFLLREDSSINHLIGKFTATDDDHSDNGKIEYHLQSAEDSSKFVLSLATGNLFLAKPLDREEKSIYTLTIIAKDKGLTPLSASITCTVIVTDVNDEKPICEKNVYETSLSEKATIRNNFLQVKANDLDEGPNSVISYSILSGNEGNQFSINSKTGQLQLNKRLNYEWKHEHEVTIQAKDSPTNGEALFGFCTVKVHVEDENEYPPQFPRPVFTAAVKENQTPPTKIMSIPANDKDGGRYGYLEYQLLTKTKEFFIKSSTLYTNITMDYEGVRNYKLEILVKDAGDKSAKANLYVEVEPLKPIFTEEDYLFQIFANVRVGQYIGQVKAVDQRTPKSPVTYSIVSNNPASQKFSINSTGHVKTTANLINIKEERLELTIRAQAGTRSSLVTVWITLSRDCEGCSPSSGSSESDGLLLVLMVIFGIIAVIACVIIVVFLILRKTRRKKVPPPATFSTTTSSLPRTSNGFLHSDHHSSPTSGRGSVSEVDKEITMINDSRTSYSSGDRVADSGLPDETPPTPLNHVEYLARLGIEPVKVNGRSIESIQSFGEEGGGTYMWDHLLNWQPEFANMSQVFTEIGDLQDIAVRKEPTKIVQQRTNTAFSVPRTDPPPVLTSTPPRTVNQSNTNNQFEFRI
ncbi:DgyrCDS14066 [Dimorphilus gyrociliatus]|uniref:DgyrCDS14066 n=1 Tax=Dimorphilus gyrociliatus TaxID=2664684 RepID=A0A7I8WCG6_9ANNE|nr:DgyrCDS14066 [Dimorphilus gyrociliatus]